MKRYFDTVILGLGLFFLAFSGYLLIERNTSRHLVYADTSPTKVVSPIRLTIKSIGLELPIIGAHIVDSKWDITKDGVSYLVTTPLPGSLGNSVMYGHNWSNLLGDLDRVKTGDTITVQNSDGVSHHYIVHFISVVTPDETHIYTNTPDYRLTLYTCTGFLDSKRLVVTAVKE
ncbi:sortase [Candidatus Woesebacteria bacterium]|nr:sortase [Candidatus Woesebacteria bacterium]